MNSIDMTKFLLPGMRTLLQQALTNEFEEQEKQFRQRENAIRERLTHIACEIALKVAAAASYDEASRTITIQMKLPS